MMMLVRSCIGVERTCVLIAIDLLERMNDRYW